MIRTTDCTRMLTDFRSWWFDENDVFSLWNLDVNRFEQHR